MCSHLIILWTAALYVLGWVIYIISAVQCDYKPQDRVVYDQLHAVTVHAQEMAMFANPVKYAALDSIIGSEKLGTYLVRMDSEIAASGGVCALDNPKCAMSADVEKIDHFSLVENMRALASMSSTHNPSLLVAVIGIVVTWISMYSMRRELHALLHTHDRDSSFVHVNMSYAENYILHSPAFAIFAYIAAITQTMILFFLCFVVNNRSDSNSTFMYCLSLLFWTLYLQPMESFEEKKKGGKIEGDLGFASAPEKEPSFVDDVNARETQWDVSGFNAHKARVLAPKFGAYMIKHVPDTAEVQSANLTESAFDPICVDFRRQLALSYAQVLLIPATFVSLLMVHQRFDINTQFQKLVVLTTLYCVLDVVWDRVELVGHYVHTLLPHSRHWLNPLSLNTLLVVFVQALVLYSVFDIICLSAVAGKTIPSSYYMYRFWLLYVYMLLSTLFLVLRSLWVSASPQWMPCEQFRVYASNVLTCTLMSIVATCVMHAATASIA